jgi:hypothetical protein
MWQTATVSSGKLTESSVNFIKPGPGFVKTGTRISEISSDGHDKLLHFGDAAAEANTRRHLSQMRPRQLAGEDKWRGDLPGQLGQKLIQLEAPGNAGQMSIKIVGLFGLADEFHIL